MKKSKRILALIIAVLLFGLYGSTLIFAIIGNPVADSLLKAAIAGTVLLPALMYGYTLLYRLSHKEKQDDSHKK